MKFKAKITVDEERELNLEINEPTYSSLADLLDCTERYFNECIDISNCGIITSLTKIDPEETDVFLLQLSVNERQDSLERINLMLKDVMINNKLELTERVKNKIYDALQETYEFVDSDDD